MDKDVTHIYNGILYIMEYYPAIKMKIIPTAATWMQLEIITLREASKRKANTMRYHSYMAQVNLSMKQRTDAQTQKKD